MMSDSTAASAPTPRHEAMDFSNLKLSVPLKTTKATVDAAKKSRRRSRFLRLRDDSCECLYPKLVENISPKGKTSSDKTGDDSDGAKAIQSLKSGISVPTLPGLDRGDSNSTSSTVSTSASALSSRSERGCSNQSESIVDRQISVDGSPVTTSSRPQLGSQDSLSSLGSNDPVNANGNPPSAEASPIPSGVADDIDIEEQRRLLEQFSFSMTMNTLLSTSDARRNSSPAQFARAKTRKTLAEMEEEQFLKLGRNQQRNSQRILTPSSLH